MPVAAVVAGEVTPIDALVIPCAAVLDVVVRQQASVVRLVILYHLLCISAG